MEPMYQARYRPPTGTRNHCLIGSGALVVRAQEFGYCHQKCLASARDGSWSRLFAQRCPLRRVARGAA